MSEPIDLNRYREMFITVTSLVNELPNSVSSEQASVRLQEAFYWTVRTIDIHNRDLETKKEETND